ncbi:MAG TPA: DUF2891 domain-containing protein [Rhizomicrobium sp.]|jgi:hypothetical protein|nr:DUF2891 domain-containing protein [Rhizomicrobium sp.]
MATQLMEQMASRFAQAALGHVGREWPNKLDHVMAGHEDVQPPRALHPIFFGSFDWHSCVHGYWLLARLYRRVPHLPGRKCIRALFDARLVPANIAAETAYLARAQSRGFERPYGWAWALMLAGELARHESAEGQIWSRNFAPLAGAFVERFESWLPLATYPIRAGVHTNTAFAVLLALDYAGASGNDNLAALLRGKALTWYSGDADCQAWEPCGDDFLSSALVEAACMRAALGRDAFAPWLMRFLPRLAQGEPAALFTPAFVSDRSDGKIAHLDGLNLSRAWCWRLILDAIDGAGPRARIEQTISHHLDSALPHVTGDYMGEHWLASFALLALDHTLPSPSSAGMANVAEVR